MIKERKVIIRVFDNILSAETAKRVLLNAGIKSTILNYSKINFSAFINQAYEINLAVPSACLDEAKKLLEI